MLLGVSLAFNVLQLAGMHAVLPDGLVRRASARRASAPPPTWPASGTESSSHRAGVAQDEELPLLARGRHAAAGTAAQPMMQLTQPAVQRGLGLGAEVAALAGGELPELQQVAGPTPSRHPTYRLAFTVPWLGRSFPSWFPYFLASCRRSSFLVDWLIFHEDAAAAGLENAACPVCAAASSARLVARRARAAPTHPRAQPEQLGTVPWPH